MPKNTIARSSHTAPLAKATIKFVSKPTSLRSIPNSRSWRQCVSGVWVERKSLPMPRNTTSPCHTLRNRPTQPMKICGASPAKVAKSNHHRSSQTTTPFSIGARPSNTRQTKLRTLPSNSSKACPSPSTTVTFHSKRSSNTVTSSAANTAWVCQPSLKIDWSG